MEEALVTYLLDASADDALTIAYHVGDGFSGETDLILEGNGDYRLWSTVTQGRQRRNYSGAVPVETVQALVREIVRVRLWEVDHVVRDRGRDNPETRIDVRVGEDGFSAVLWVSEVDDVPPFDEIQQQILALARSLSDGDVLEVGR